MGARHDYPDLESYILAAQRMGRGCVTRQPTV